MASERLTAQLWFLSPRTIQRRGKAGARNGQLTGNNLPTLSAIGEAAESGLVLADQAFRFWLRTEGSCDVSGVDFLTVPILSAPIPANHL